MFRFRKYAIMLIWLAFLASLPSGGAQAQTRHLFWTVGNGAQSAHLLGSVHFGTPDFYPLPTAIMEAFAAADALAVEVNILAIDAAEVARLTLSKGMYKDNVHNLKANVRPETWRLLNETAPRFGLPIEFLGQQKPWLVGMTLSAMMFKQAGFREDLGVDYFFLKQATEGHKPIIELESFASQIGLFEGLSTAEQDEFLLQTLQDIHKGEDYLKRIIRAWKIGDDAAIDQLVNSDIKNRPGMERLYKLMLADRNVAMADTIEGLLKQGKQPFVVVGAGHLVGADSVVEHLRAKGYRIEQR